MQLSKYSVSAGPPLRLRFKVFQLYRADGRQFLCRFYSETPQKFFCRTQQDRTAGGVKTSDLLYQIILYQFIDGMVTLHTADLLYLQPCDRLLYAIMDSVSSITSVSTAFFGCRAICTRLS